jgi:hypothetical protein
MQQFSGVFLLKMEKNQPTLLITFQKHQKCRQITVSLEYVSIEMATKIMGKGNIIELSQRCNFDLFSV